MKKLDAIQIKQVKALFTKYGRVEVTRSEINDLVKSGVITNPSWLKSDDYKISFGLYSLPISNTSKEINKKQAIDLVSKDGMSLSDLSDVFKNDREVVLAAVKKDFSAFKYADDSFKKNINISNINFKKIKEDMDQDGDFLHWDTDEKVSITRSGFENQTEYRVFVESDQNDDTGEYDVYGEFGSSIDEIEETIECFLDNGGDIISFLINGYLNIEKSILEKK